MLNDLAQIVKERKFHWKRKNSLLEFQGFKEYFMI